MPKVSFEEAIVEYNNKTAQFIFLNPNNKFKLNNFLEVSLEDLGKKFPTILNNLEKANLNKIYILDFNGFDSSRAVYLLKNEEQFASYDIRVISGGLLRWEIESHHFKLYDRVQDTALNQRLADFPENMTSSRVAEILTEFDADIKMEPFKYDYETNSVIKQIPVSEFNDTMVSKFLAKYSL